MNPPLRRADLGDYAAFVAIAEERSFRRAATRLGVSSSALSHSLRAMEERLGLKLLNRTTRSVAPTEAGLHLLIGLRPALDAIEQLVQSLGPLRDRPAGRVRVSVHRRAAIDLIAPKLGQLKKDFPDVVVEIAVEDGLTDIVAAGFDIGVRSGEMIAKDMISVRMGHDRRTAVVASPSYLAGRPVPHLPEDLGDHVCAAYRRITSGELHRWEFARDGRSLTVAVNAGFIANDADMLIEAALAGIGFAYVFEEQVAAQVSSGTLVKVLEDWAISYAGDYMYFPSRRQMQPAMRVFVDFMRLGGR